MPLTIPIFAHRNWTADISGNVRIAVHRVAKPSEAPAIEYVPIPEGSSSAAPVIRPGPSAFRNRFNAPGFEFSGCFVFVFGITRDIERRNPLTQMQMARE